MTTFLEALVGGGLGMAIVGFFLKSYLGSYLTAKGKNLATFEDIQKLVAQVQATEEAKAGISAKMWDRQARWTAKQQHYEKVVIAVHKEGKALAECCDALETDTSAASETLQAVNTAQREGLNAMTVAALYMSDPLFRAHSELTTASAHLRKAITTPYNAVTAKTALDEYSRLFADLINTARADLGYEEGVTILNRFGS
jgi:hypothetical protein